MIETGRRAHCIEATPARPGNSGRRLTRTLSSSLSSLGRAPVGGIQRRWKCRSQLEQVLELGGVGGTVGKADRRQKEFRSIFVIKLVGESRHGLREQLIGEPGGATESGVCNRGGERGPTAPARNTKTIKRGHLFREQQRST
jgi:hypothetical protein